ncbi:reverse transcriptase domain-containing protein [Tanacetum coccineum]
MTVNAVFTRSAKSYNLPDNPDDQQNNFENPINFDSDDEDDEPTPEPKTQPNKTVKETPLPKPYKPKILSFQYPVGIVENMLVEVGKFTFLSDFVILKMEEDNKVPLILGRPFLHTADAVYFRDNRRQLNVDIDVIDEILEEDFNALLDEGTKILHSIEGTLLEEEIFYEFDEFLAMIADENSESEFDTKEPAFEKITINTDYKIKTSLK